MADDEFGDDNIDWTAVALPPSIPATEANHPRNNTSYNISQPQSGRQQSHSRYHSGYDASNANTTGGNASNAMPVTTMRSHPTSALENEELKRQIADLQNQLEAKNDQMFDLEAAAATSAAESSALAQRLERDAKNRIHLVEEELRRVKREADQYKGQWVRAKKRVAELEAGSGGESGRAITPSNADHFHHRFDPDVRMEDRSERAGAKRKADSGRQVDHPEATIAEVAAPIVMSRPVSRRYDSVRQRVVKHLLLRDDMGCYSLENCITHLSKSLDAEIDQGSDPGGNVTPSKGEQRPNKTDADNKSAQAIENQVEQETISFVKSILCHMLEDATTAANDINNTHHAMSVSGLVRVLLERFNTLFFECDASEQRHDPNEMDVDPAADNNTKGCHGMALVVCSGGLQVRYATHSWRAVLYILHVLHDVLLLSGKARGDLRWWFYQALQSGKSDYADDDVDTTREVKYQSPVNSRIEGLPSKSTTQASCAGDRREALWTIGCRPIANQDVGWEPSTMTSSCSLFYEILVGLMKGHVFASSQKAYTLGEGDKKITQYAQIRSIEFVSCLMSDAPPSDHAELNCRNKTPYLWKFWFDSLFPLYSSTGSATDTSELGDFFSLWEKSVGHHGQKLLGSGRKYCTLLRTSTLESDVQPIKLSGEKQSSKSDKTKSIATSAHRKELEHMVLGAKCTSLQLMSHFIVSSSSLHQSIHQVYSSKSTNEAVSLAKRVLFAVLDELDEFVIPFISLTNNSSRNLTDLGRCLELCYSCMLFLVVLSRSDAGIHLLRIQTKLDFEIGGRSRWSTSAIACVTSILDSVLSYFVESDASILRNSGHASLLKKIAEECMLFYKNLLSFVHNQPNGRERSRLKAASMLALVAEKHYVFVSCCQRVLSLDKFREELKYEARLLLEEVLLDDEE